MSDSLASFTASSASDAGGGFAACLRRFRAGRRMSQMTLALECEVSPRHVSFLESGRAQPSRDMALRLAAGLLLPLGSRNLLLQAAGFAPHFPVSPLDSAALTPLRAVLAEMMTRHTPWPALLCDRHWTVLDANAPARLLLAALGGGAAPLNVVRMMTDMPHAGETIVNLGDMLAEMQARIELEALEAGDDPVLAAHLQALAAARQRHPKPATGQPRRPLVPLVVRAYGRTLSFLSAIAQFGTCEDVTVRDLRLELLFPADDATREALAAAAAEHPTAFAQTRAEAEADAAARFEPPRHAAVHHRPLE